MTSVLALDPSVRSPGAALFCDAELLFAGRKSFAAVIDEQEGERWDRVAASLVDWLVVNTLFSQVTPDILIYERPQWYTPTKSKGDPNDLAGLAAVGAAFAARLRQRSPETRILTPTPAEWIGQVSKATRGSALDSPRAKKIMSRLSPAERERVPNQHDAIDAIGLGLHALGRLGTRRVYRTS